MAKGNENGSARSSKQGTFTSKVGIIGRTMVVLLVLATAAMLAGSTSAAPLGFLDSVKEFFGVTAPQLSAEPSLLESGTTAPEAEMASMVLNTTTTTVSCSPQSFGVGASTTCTVTVTDTAPSGAVPPVGNVTFSTSGAGNFSGNATGSCTLSMRRSSRTPRASPAARNVARPFELRRCCNTASPDETTRPRTRPMAKGRRPESAPSS